MSIHKLKGRALHLLLMSMILLGSNAFFEVGISEAAEREVSAEPTVDTLQPPPSEPEKTDQQWMPGWWQRHVAFSGDLRAALAMRIRGNRDGANQTDVSPVARVRGGANILATPWLDATARLAAFFDKDIQGIGFRFSHRRDIQPGDVTFDSLFLTLRPYELLTIMIGRLQTSFELDSVVRDSLSRHDSSGLEVNWTDGVYAIIGGPSSFRLHLIGQANPKEGPTNGVGVRGPLDFSDGASRVTYYLGLEAPRFTPFTQLLAELTIIPQALRPLGLGTEPKEDVVTFTIKAAADFPIQDETDPLTVHPFLEFGATISTPRESAIGIFASNGRAEHFAFVTGFDLKRLGPGALGIQLGWVQDGYLISPDYPNNTWSIEMRYQVSITMNTMLEIRYRHRQEIDKLAASVDREIDDNVFARVTVNF